MKEIEGITTISLVVITTVFISIFVHGITAGPGSERYVRIVKTLPPNAPERGKIE
jgi:NhaP-type Na+/H+ or K+/H+ antiporter